MKNILFNICMTLLFIMSLAVFGMIAVYFYLACILLGLAIAVVGHIHNKNRGDSKL